MMQHSSKRELESQLVALQDDMASLSATLYASESKYKPTTADEVVDNLGERGYIFCVASSQVHSTWH